MFNPAHQVLKQRSSEVGSKCPTVKRGSPPTLTFRPRTSCEKNPAVFSVCASPVHDEAVGDDHFVQIVLVMSGDTEEVQIVSLLIIRDLGEEQAAGLKAGLCF